jgi:hypothetical protein
MVIATYRPYPGRDRELLKILREQGPVLRGEGIVTERAPVVMRAEDGTIVEAFELTSDQSIERAQGSAKVRALWERLQKVCQCVNLRGAAEPAPLPPGATSSPLPL